nr:transmembrane protein 14C isoform X1 [Vicugna pacos]
MQKDSGPLVPLHWIGFGYAALVASGGIIGYAKAGSVPSLAAGLFFGGLAGLGAYQLSQDPRNIWVFLATSGTLAGIMGMRFYHSGKFMPAGLIAGARADVKVRAESVTCSSKFALGNELAYLTFGRNTETMHFESLMNALLTSKDFFDVKMTEP